VFFGFGALLVAAAAALLANGWASDETNDRLEVLLGAPLTRARWVIESGLGVMAAIAAMALLTAVLVAAGVVAAGDDPWNPVLGVLVLGAYCAALAGVGLAVGGLFRAGIAAVVAGGVGLAFYLLDVLGAALQLPEAVLDLSLTQHLGMPMAGVFDGVGVAVCLALAIGGVIVAALGLGRRDIER
jgi:ABC-2 type transport system permease protein